MAPQKYLNYQLQDAKATDAMSRRVLDAMLVASPCREFPQAGGQTGFEVSENLQINGKLLFKSLNAGGGHQSLSFLFNILKVSSE